jgi:hypothetical protein
MTNPNASISFAELTEAVQLCANFAMIKNPADADRRACAFVAALAGVMTSRDVALSELIFSVLNRDNQMSQPFSTLQAAIDAVQRCG